MFEMSDSNSLGDGMMTETLAASLCLQNMTHGPDSLGGKLNVLCHLLGRREDG